MERASAQRRELPSKHHQSRFPGSSWGAQKVAGNMGKGYSLEKYHAPGRAIRYHHQRARKGNAG
jgi:hypothetical protein